MSARKVLDNFEKRYPDLQVTYRWLDDKGNSHFTKWHKWKEWPHEFMPNYRTILPNEIVLETDRPKKEDNDSIAQGLMKRLREHGIPHYAMYTGNKSTHVHFFIKHPRYNNEYIANNKKYIIGRLFKKDELFRLIDEANLNPRRMIQVEYSKNPKTGKPSEMIVIDGNGEYELPYDLNLNTALPVKDKQITLLVNKTEVLDNKAPRYCPFIEYCVKNELPGYGDKNPYPRNTYIAPNVAAYVLANKQKAHMLEDYYKSQKSQVKKEWLTSKPEFSCKNLQTFANHNGLSKYCDICRKYNMYDSYRKNIYINKKKQGVDKE